MLSLGTREIGCYVNNGATKLMVIGRLPTCRLSPKLHVKEYRTSHKGHNQILWWCTSAVNRRNVLRGKLETSAPALLGFAPALCGSVRLRVLPPFPGHRFFPTAKGPFRGLILAPELCEDAEA